MIDLIQNTNNCIAIDNDKYDWHKQTLDWQRRSLESNWLRQKHSRPKTCQRIYRESSLEARQWNDLQGAPRSGYRGVWLGFELVWVPAVHFRERRVRGLWVHHFESQRHPWLVQIELRTVPRGAILAKPSPTSGCNLEHSNQRLVAFRKT